MSTGMIIALIVIVAVVVVVAAVLLPRARAGVGDGGSLRRRFGPEYDRTLARHDGDERAAACELTERLKRYGSLERQPLRAEERRRYEVRWAAAQERFVESPREAVAEADRLLGEVAGARGFPDGERYEARLEALSVHHGRHVQGYRRVHRAARTAPGAAEGRDGTEEMREAMVEARGLFDELVAAGRREEARADREGRSGRSPGRAPMPWAFTRRHAKGS
ncbi:hypothetical protein ACWD4G_29280 [Streptomyces sp. NPDC002643]